jgi:hypothetical protein
MRPITISGMTKYLSGGKPRFRSGSGDYRKDFGLRGGQGRDHREDSGLGARLRAHARKRSGSPLHAMLRKAKTYSFVRSPARSA